MQPVFRNWDQAELDRQLSPRSTVPNADALIQDYADASRREAEGLEVYDTAYGPDAAERLLVFPQQAGEPAPVLVYLHGGYWRLLDAASSRFMARTFVRAGAVVVVVNYALCPGVTLEVIVRQCRDALAWVFGHAAGFGGDPARVHLCGSSAGAHLAAMLLAEDHEGGRVAGATLLSGLFDLAPVRLGPPNAWLRLDEAEARRLSPVRRPPVRSVPLIVTYAESDTDEFKRQSEVYMALAADRGCEVAFVPLPGTNHFTNVLALMDDRSPLTQAVFERMGLRGGQGGAR